MHKKYQPIIEEHAQDILSSKNTQTQMSYIQHGRISVYEHCMRVAIMSLAIASFASLLHLPINKRALIRGALLHDYFLYDWHHKGHSMHGFTHAECAYQNACKEYELNPIETDIIKKHMFPLNIKPPLYKESIIVCIADKICAVKETFQR